MHLGHAARRRRTRPPSRSQRAPLRRFNFIGAVTKVFNGGAAAGWAGDAPAWRTSLLLAFSTNAGFAKGDGYPDCLLSRRSIDYAATNRYLLLTMVISKSKIYLVLTYKFSEFPPALAHSS